MKLEIVLPGGTGHPKELEQVVDEDIRSFDAWFQKKVETDPLTPAEKAIIKDYLWWKLRG